MAKASRSNRANHTSSASGGNPTFVMAALVGSSENSVSMTSKTTTRGCVLMRKGFPFHRPSIPASGAVGGMSSDGSWKGMWCSAVARSGDARRAEVFQRRPGFRRHSLSPVRRRRRAGPPPAGRHGQQHAAVPTGSTRCSGGERSDSPSSSLVCSRWASVRSATDPVSSYAATADAPGTLSSLRCPRRRLAGALLPDEDPRVRRGNGCRSSRVFSS